MKALKVISSIALLILLLTNSLAYSQGFEGIIRKEAEMKQKRLEEIYGPQPGDSRRVVALKRQMLEQKIAEEEAARLAEKEAKFQEQFVEDVKGVPGNISVDDYVNDVMGREDEYIQQAVGTVIMGSAAAEESLKNLKAPEAAKVAEADSIKAEALAAASGESSQDDNYTSDILYNPLIWIFVGLIGITLVMMLFGNRKNKEI